MAIIMEIVKSLIFFVLACLCEIGGGYLVWIWLREGRGFEFAILGAILLILYGVIPTLQPEFWKSLCSIWWNFHSARCFDIFIKSITNSHR
jgi:Uncharacterised BCR, YnfA/UPF0060 family